jgi:ribosomal protein S18 acetylase RimI-like enzyme
VNLRGYAATDEAAVVELWHATKRAAYPYLPAEQTRSMRDDAAFFREHIAARCDVWLAERDGTLLGFLALADGYLDRLYVHPSAQREGVGAALLAKARELSPAGLDLHTHQQNVSACSFYEKHGFRAHRFGTSGPPECMPDVLYRWRPGAVAPGISR